MRKSKQTEEDRIKVTYKFAEGVSKEEAQRNLESAFDILFNAVVKNRKQSIYEGTNNKNPKRENYFS